MAQRRRSRGLTKMPGVAQDELRRHNLSAVLRYVHVHGPTTRAVLTAETGLNRSTIRALTADLIAAGLVREELPTDRGRAGRPSLVVHPESSRVYVLAFDLGVDFLVAGRIGLGGRVLARLEAERPRGDYPPAEAVSRLAAFARELLVEDGRCLGVGVGVAGLVRDSDGLVRLGPNLGWTDVPLGEMLRKAIPGLPVSVGNDADLGARAEQVRGAGAGATDIVYLTGEAGVGGGVISDGRPLRGRGGYAGEVGHMIVNRGGRLCRCGARGCWETEIGEAALLDAADSPGTERSSFGLVLDAAARGDAVALRAVRQVGGWLGVGVRNLVNILNPEVVIFGGLLRPLFPLVEADLHATLQGGGLVAPTELVRLLAPALGADSTLHGAAELAFTPLLADPLGTP
jgi:predicted NBD/HSP70 family sugar kinase